MLSSLFLLMYVCVRWNSFFKPRVDNQCFLGTKINQVLMNFDIYTKGVVHAQINVHVL